MAVTIPSMDEMIDGTLRRTRGPMPTWTQDEVKAVDIARDALQMLNATSPRESLFDAIRPCFPFAAGMIEMINSTSPTELLDAIYNVPDSFLLSRAQHIANDLAIPFIQRIPVGIVVRGTDALPGRLFMALEYNQIMYPHHGFDHVTGMAVTRSTSDSETESEVIWLFTKHKARLPTWREARLLELVHRDIQEALHRIRIPLLPHEPIRYQIMREQCVGYMLVSLNGVVREANRRAALLANHYAPVNTPSGLRLGKLVARIYAAPASRHRPVRYLRGSNETGLLEVGTHQLKKEKHAIDEDLVLIEMREVEGAAGSQLKKLSPRQREVAMLLARSGKSYKQIASDLNISEGTMRKHAERIYHALDVNSRFELIALVNGA